MKLKHDFLIYLNKKNFWAIRIENLFLNWFGFIRIDASDWVGLILECFLSNEVQNVFRIGSETDSGVARNSSDSLGINFNPILSPGNIYFTPESG